MFLEKQINMSICVKLRLKKELYLWYKGDVASFAIKQVNSFFLEKILVAI